MNILLQFGLQGILFLKMTTFVGASFLHLSQPQVFFTYS